MAAPRDPLFEVLDYLTELGSRDLLNLRACCKQYRQYLTGAMPPHASWTLTAKSPSEKVMQLVRLAGPKNVHRLKVIQQTNRDSYVPGIPQLCNLELLDILYWPRVCGTHLHISSFACLQRLQVLSITCASSAGSCLGIVTGLDKLLGLSALNLVNACPRALPPHVTRLSYEDADPNSYLHEKDDNIAELIKAFPGSLRDVSLGLSAFGNCAAHLVQAACLQHASRLQLDICDWTHQGFGWCVGFFSQLQVLQVSFRPTPSFPHGVSGVIYSPQWDLSCCSRLQELSLIVHSLTVDLRGIRNVTATTFQLTLPNFTVQTGLPMACESWSLKEAAIVCCAVPLGQFPAHISHVEAALMHTRGGPPVLKVNGLSMTQHAMCALQRENMIGCG